MENCRHGLSPHVTKGAKDVLGPGAKGGNMVEEESKKKKCRKGGQNSKMEPPHAKPTRHDKVFGDHPNKKQITVLQTKT